MDNRSKYVIFANSLGDLTAILFPILVTHAEIALDLRNRLGEPVSAGFVSFDPHPFAHGESVSLRLRSQYGDSRLIAEQFGMERPKVSEPDAEQ